MSDPWNHPQVRTAISVDAALKADPTLHGPLERLGFLLGIAWTEAQGARISREDFIEAARIFSSPEFQREVDNAAADLRRNMGKG